MNRGYISRANRFPPILCRILARHKNGKPLTLLEISDRSKLAPSQVQAISWCTDWRGIDVYEMENFTSACGVNFGDRKQMKRKEIYLRKGPAFAYLRRSPEWESLFKPLLTHYMKSIVDNTKHENRLQTVH